MSAENSIVRDGHYVARVFKYYRQYTAPNIRFKLSLERIQAKTFYSKYARTFDTLARIFSDRGIDVHEYVKFFVLELGKTEMRASELLARASLMRFVEKKTKTRKFANIYEWYSKSVSNMAQLCVEHGYQSSKEGLRKLIAKHKLNTWYVCGKISKYYLCAIPGFAKVIPRLDDMTKNDMHELAERYDMYNSEVNEALLYMKHRRANPFADTDAEISRVFVKGK